MPRITLTAWLSTNMKLSATLKNNRGGQKTTADDTRILIDLKIGNRFIGTLGFYIIKDEKMEGHNIIWHHEKPFGQQVNIESIEKAKQLTDNKCTHQNCDDNGNCHACDVNVFK